MPKRHEKPPRYDYRLLSEWMRTDPDGFRQLITDLGKPLEAETLARILADKRELSQYPSEEADGEV